MGSPNASTRRCSAGGQDDPDARHLPAPVNFWYYRDQRGQEVDFVRDAGGVLSFMECKWSERPTLRDARGLLRVSAGLAASNSPWRPGPHYVIGRPVSGHSLGEGVAAVALRDLPAIVSGNPPP